MTDLEPITTDEDPEKRTYGGRSTTEPIAKPWPRALGALLVLTAVVSAVAAVRFHGQRDRIERTAVAVERDRRLEHESALHSNAQLHSFISDHNMDGELIGARTMTARGVHGAGVTLTILGWQTFDSVRLALVLDAHEGPGLELQIVAATCSGTQETYTTADASPSSGSAPGVGEFGDRVVWTEFDRNRLATQDALWTLIEVTHSNRVTQTGGDERNFTTIDSERGVLFGQHPLTHVPGQYPNVCP